MICIGDIYCIIRVARMSRILQCAFVSLTVLLFVILLGFLLLFTDVGLSPSLPPYSHLDNGRIWAGKKLRISAELAYSWSNTMRAETSKLSSLVDSTDHRNGRGEEDDGKENDKAQKSREKETESDLDSLLHENDVQIGNSLSKQEPLTGGQNPTEPFRKDNKMPFTIKESYLPIVGKISIEKDTSELGETDDKQHERVEIGRGSATVENVTEKSAAPSASTLAETTPTSTPESESESRVALEYPSHPEQEEEEEEEENEDELNVHYDEEESILEDEQSIKLAFSNDGITEDKTIIEESKSLVSRNFSDVRSLAGYIKPELVERARNVLFKMPCPKVFQSTTELVVAPWMKPLLRILSSFKGKQVTLVIANNAYRDVLLNWLISAKIVSKPPIDNILVVSLDHSIYSLLISRDIPTVLAPFGTLLNSKHRFRRFFELIMMMRLGFMRLINRLGYDCAMYDIDAVILKNPQPLYEQWGSKDIIGSRGQLPKELWRRWGVTICIGAVFIRSNSRTETYWEAVHDVKIRPNGMANDQIRLNHGLRQLHVEWEQDRKTNRLHQEYEPAIGSCGSSENSLSIVVLPYGSVCRFGCRADSRSKYFIWHKGGSRDKKSKMKGAKQGKTWFLKERWSELDSNTVINVRGTKWLKRISTGV